MIVKPVIAVKKRKIERRAREQTDFARTLILYADATKSWISKGVRFPLSTLEQVIKTPKLIVSTVRLCAVLTDHSDIISEMVVCIGYHS